MLFSLKKTLLGQIIVLAAATFLCLAAEIFLHIRLPLRPSFTAFIIGLAWSLPVLAISLVALSPLSAFLRRKLISDVDSEAAGFVLTRNRIAGAILVSACAEEPVFRGLVITLLKPYSSAGSIIASGAVSLLCYLRGRNNLDKALAEAFKALALGFAYLSTRSIFSVIVARCAVEILLVSGSERIVTSAINTIRLRVRSY
jgi:hypothetical protein